jgi:hypothetical protein
MTKKEALKIGPKQVFTQGPKIAQKRNFIDLVIK